jgi:hypothetical protein
VHDTMQNRGAVPRSRSIGSLEKPVDPQLSAHLERIRTLLGQWTEPILLAYGRYARQPEEHAGLEQLLKVCCEAARQITHASGAAFAALSEAEFIYRMNAGEVVPTIGASVATESGFPGACLKSRQAFLSNHVSTDQRVDPAVRQGDIKSLIAVPIIEDDGALGFLAVVSRNQNPFTVSHVVSLQFIASLVGGVLSDLRQPKRDKASADSLPPQAVGPPGKKEIEPAPAFSSNSRPAVELEAAKVVPNVSSIAPPVRETPAAQGRPEPQPAPPANSSAKSITATPPEPPKPSEPVPEASSGGATAPAERRSRARTLVDCLAYVSLGEENGGILLDINDAGFCMQTALPLDPGAARQRRARLAGNGELETDCELVWDQAGQAGFRFVNLSADIRSKLQAWIAANGIAPLSQAGMVPQPERNPIAVSALARLDELRSMLLNSKLTKGVGTK